MTLYDFQCKECEHEFEEILSLNNYKFKPGCPECGGQTKKLITLGGIQDDHPVWLDESVIRQLQDNDNPDAKIIETRGEYKQYLRDNGIIPDR